MNVLYNEIEPYCCDWTENLIRDGRITPGKVDRRSIADLLAEDVVGLDRAHFFSGIGVWDYALRCAGWPLGEIAWTASCPCQPFSQAGKGGGVDDERHLWPEFFRLVKIGRPPTIFGEQVASPDGLGWLDAVRADLEGAGYAFAASDLCAAGVGAPHIRQRLYFCARLADADGQPCGQGSENERGRDQGGASEPRPGSGGGGSAGELADTPDFRWPERTRGAGGASARPETEPDRLGDVGGLGHHHHHQGLEGRRLSAQRAGELFTGQTGLGRFWSGADWLYCQDNRLRPVEPGTFPLAHGDPSRVGRIRAYGNAIVAPLATTFVKAVMEIL